MSRDAENPVKRQKKLKLTYIEPSHSQLEMRIMATVGERDFCAHNATARLCLLCVREQIWVVF